MKQINQVHLNFSNKRVSGFESIIPFLIRYNEQSQNFQVALDLSQNNIISQNLKNSVKQFEKLNNFKNKQNVQITQLIAHSNLLQNIQWIVEMKQLLKQLTHLYLEHNKLKSLKGLQQLNTQKIERLTINNNLLTSEQLLLVNQLKLTELRILCLDTNKLTSTQFITSLNCPKLLSLTLSQNKINCLDLTNSVYIKCLYKLQLNHNVFQSIKLGICNFENLKQIDLSHNKITSAEGITFLKLDNLQKLKLNNNFITNPRFIALLDAVNLVDLQIKQNKINQITRESIRKSNFKKLQGLFLTKNIFTSNFNMEIILGLSKCQLKNIALWTKFNISHKHNSLPFMKRFFNKIAFYEN